MKILFITSNRVGDAVLSTGILASLVATYKEASFTIACGPYASDLFRAVPRLERVIILRKQSWNRHWLRLWQTTFGRNWDLIVDLRNSLVTRFLRADHKVYHRSLPGEHKVIEIAKTLDLNPPPAPHIWLDDQAKNEASRLLGNSGSFFAVGPAANWSLKQWPVEKFISLTQKLMAEKGSFAQAKLLVIADEKEREQIVPLLRSLPSDKSIPIIGHNLLTVAACLERCRLFIGNDSGLMHLSAAVLTPTLGLFGPGYENIYGPWGAKTAFVRTPEPQAELLGRIPKSGAAAPNLMASLSVETVFDAAEKLLVKTGSTN